MTVKELKAKLDTFADEQEVRIEVNDDGEFHDSHIVSVFQSDWNIGLIVISSEMGP